MSDDNNKDKNLIKAQNEKIKGLKKEIKDLDTEVTSLTEEKANLETQVATLTTEQEVSYTEVLSLNAQVTALTEAANTPNAEVISLQEEKAELSKTIDDMYECISSTPTCSDDWDMIKEDQETNLAGKFCIGLFDQCVDFYN
jgi:chromosome segregation ATPase